MDKPGICDNCNEVKDYKRCAQCRAAKYCSRTCQKNHWKTHKETCKVFQTNSNSVSELLRLSKLLKHFATIFKKELFDDHLSFPHHAHLIDVHQNANGVVVIKRFNAEGVSRMKGHSQPTLEHIADCALDMRKMVVGILDGDEIMYSCKIMYSTRPPPSIE